MIVELVPENNDDTVVIFRAGHQLDARAIYRSTATFCLLLVGIPHMIGCPGENISVGGGRLDLIGLVEDDAFRAWTKIYKH